MRTWEELWIKFWGHISIDDITRWDVIELDYPTGNRRFIVSKIENDYIHIDNRDVISKANPDIVWVIRGFPDDDEMKELIKDNKFCIDVPDTERKMAPYFADGMIKQFKPDTPYKFNTVLAPTASNVLSGRWLSLEWFYLEKRWILWDTLKFYAVWQKVSYFI